MPKRQDLRAATGYIGIRRVWEYEWFSATDDKIYVWQVRQRPAFKAVSGTGAGLSCDEFIYGSDRVLSGGHCTAHLRDLPFVFKGYRKDVGAEPEISELAVSEACKIQQYKKALGAAKGIPLLSVPWLQAESTCAKGQGKDRDHLSEMPCRIYKKELRDYVWIY